jgi:hypothetical protein
MKRYQMNQGLYITPTPAGAYYSVSDNEPTPPRRLLHRLLSQKTSPLLTIEKLKQWQEVDDDDEVLDLLFHAQNLGWVGGVDKPIEAPQGVLEEVLPDLLSNLTDTNKALLADSQGFYICSKGFPHETAEELSALSADIASMHDRHRHLIQKNLGLSTSAWSLVDAAGCSQVGFWPMYVGDQRFVLVISGLPYLNQLSLTSLIWALCKRYGS